MGDNDRRSAVKKLKYLIFSSKSEPVPFRKKLEAHFTSVFLPNNVERSEQDFGGVMCDVLSPEVYAQNRVLVYVHGGSFIGGSRSSWRSFCASLANASSTKLILPEIRLAPEYPFPSAIEDICAVLRTIAKTGREIILAGDGSGAAIALSSALDAPENIRSCLKNIILFSPWLDFSPDSPLFVLKKSGDEVISADCIKRCADLYTYRSNLQNPSVSPMCASESALGLLPPVFIQMGEKEVLLPEAKRFINRLYHAGTDYELDVWPNMMHLFQMADEFLPEAHRAVEKAGNRIKKLV